jgi:putative transposase
MARLPRLSLPGYPHHVIQRGNNRQSIFSSAADYRFLLDLLRQHARQCQVAVHAYVLMGNHFHLLLTPQEGEGLPRMMQAVGRSYVQYFNRQHQRSGTLWEGRYRSTVLQTERYLLQCMAYIDLNPVRAGMVAGPQDYAWSSFAHNTGQRADPLVSPHPLYWELGNTPFAREAAYQSLVQAGVEGSAQQALTDATLRGWALGEADFVADLQKRTGRRVSKSKAGRPRSAPPEILE